MNTYRLLIMAAVGISLACRSQLPERIGQAEPCWQAVENQAQQRVDTECHEYQVTGRLMACPMLPAIMLELECRQAVCSNRTLPKECEL